MSAIKQIEAEIREILDNLEKNQEISPETLKFIEKACEQKLFYPDCKIKTYCFDFWNRKGEGGTSQVVALTAEQAEIIFKHTHPDVGYDDPYC